MSEHAARLTVKARAAGRCELCRRPGTNWSHRLARGRGGRWTVANGLWLCGSGTTGCHGWLTGEPLAAAAGGWALSAGQDPTTTPVWLWPVQGWAMPGWYVLDDAGGYALTPDTDPPGQLPPTLDRVGYPGR